MPHLQPGQAPPPDYYADNLGFLLEEVARRNDDLLAPGERAFIEAWRQADAAARRLFARLLTRKGPWFRADRLSYAEIPDSAAAVRALCRLGLVRINPPAPADALLNLFTRAELQALFPRVRATSKAAWIDRCVSAYPDAAIRNALAGEWPWLTVTAIDAFAVCRLLFFGSDRHDLRDFVLQDLGVLRFEPYEIGPHTRPFATRAEVDRYRECRALAAWLVEDEADPQIAATIRQRLWQKPASRSVARLRDRLLNRLGHLHERRGEFDEALESYALAAAPPARERRARLLRKLGDDAGFVALIEAARSAPWSAEEEDFVLRACSGSGRASVGSDLTITEIPLDRTALVQRAGGSIEGHALLLLAEQGSTGWHLENHLPLGLAGLLFWEQIFAPVAGAFSHPMQLGPRDLFWPDFARVRAAAIAARIAELRSPESFRAQLLRTAEGKAGTANRLVHWGVWTPPLVDALARLPDPAGLLAIAGMAIADLERFRAGFPDLTVIHADGALEFLEVKGPTDQLQAAQRTWLRALTNLGLRARVLKFRA